MKILVVEDDRRIASFLERGLSAEGYQVSVEHDGRDGLERARQDDFDILVLDRMLPYVDGLEMARLLREERRGAMILMLTAKDSLADKIEGLKGGADDYLTKPFAIQELEARLRALIRRERRQVGSEVLKVADLVLDPASMRATRGGTELQLSPIGMKLLTILMRESPRVVNRQEIEREIWGNGLPDSDTLRSHLYNLRKIIDKPFDKPLLHTVQSAGYRIADIDQSPA